MKNLTIAFDIDGTLRCNAEERHRTEVEPNQNVIAGLIWLASFKNINIHLWSNRGADYCQTIRIQFGLEKYVKESHCHLKTWQGNRPDGDGFVPDIAIDDQQRFDGGMINLIVREK